MDFLAPDRERFEPLLTEETNRYVVYPIRHHDVWNAYKTQMAHFWTAEELDFSQDTVDWPKLSADEQHFLKHVLAFFASSDGIVMENISSFFIDDVAWTEAKIAYGFQAMMEGVHAEVYSLMIDTFIDDAVEKADLLRGIETIPCVAQKAAWAQSYMGSEASFGERLVAFACVEGIFFSGSFCAIYWLKQRGVMPGLTTSNEFIARDEGLHTDFACLLYSKLRNRLPSIEAVIRDAVRIEQAFICDALPCALLGMNAAKMGEYIEFVADRLCVQLGYPKIFRTANPFPFMERIGLEGKDNFFEKRSASYAKAGFASDEGMTFTTDAAF